MPYYKIAMKTQFISTTSLIMLIALLQPLAVSAEETMSVFQVLKNYIYSFLGPSNSTAADSSLNFTNGSVGFAQSLFVKIFDEFDECMGAAKNFTLTNAEALIRSASSVASENMLKSINTKMVMEQFPEVFIYSAIAFAEINVIFFIVIVKTCISLTGTRKNNHRYEIAHM